VSYRHSSYRKLKKVMRAVREMSPDLDPEDYPRTAGNRVSHWLNARPMDKPFGWGVPRSKRRAV
jgi:hypothetical protein